MLTVSEAARRCGRTHQTVRRWIREGKLKSYRISSQQVIDERDLEQFELRRTVPAPAWWSETATGEPMPDWVDVIRRGRAARRTS